MLPSWLGELRLNGLPGQLLDAPGGGLDIRFHLPGELVEGCGVDADAGGLHVGEHRDQRRLHLLVDRGLVLLSQQALENACELQSDIGILDGVLDDLFEGHLADAALL